MSAVAICGPLSDLFYPATLDDGSGAAGLVIAQHILSPSVRLALASIGGLSMMWRIFEVCKDEGDDKKTCERAVDDSAKSVALLLLSFI